MPHHIKYYDSLELGFLYRVVDDLEHLSVATFYPVTKQGSGWRFIQPPETIGKIFPDHDMRTAVKAFLVSIGVEDSVMTLERE